MIPLASTLAVFIAAAPEADMGNVYDLKGSFEVAAPLELAWEVLTDYGSHARFVTDLKTSTVKDRQAHEAHVLQEAIGKVAMFTRVVKMQVTMRETPRQKITFTDDTRADFEVFEGSWSLTPTAKGVRVDYTLKCRPRGPAPGFIVGPMMDESTRRLMQQMRAEIERRAAQRRSA